jgi:hypothetical protein
LYTPDNATAVAEYDELDFTVIPDEVFGRITAGNGAPPSTLIKEFAALQLDTLVADLSKINELPHNSFKTVATCGSRGVTAVLAPRRITLVDIEDEEEEEEEEEEGEEEDEDEEEEGEEGGGGGGGEEEGGGADKS